MNAVIITIMSTLAIFLGLQDEPMFVLAGIGTAIAVLFYCEKFLKKK